MFRGNRGVDPGDKYGPLRQKICNELGKTGGDVGYDVAVCQRGWRSMEWRFENGASHAMRFMKQTERSAGRTWVHGITNRTAIMCETSSPWMTSVYNFFSDIMNQ